MLSRYVRWLGERRYFDIIFFYVHVQTNLAARKVTEKMDGEKVILFLPLFQKKNSFSHRESNEKRLPPPFLLLFLRPCLRHKSLALFLDPLPGHGLVRKKKGGAGAFLEKKPSSYACIHEKEWAGDKNEPCLTGKLESKIFRRK